MDNLKQEMDDHSCTGSDDLVEYTLEEQEEDQEEELSGEAKEENSVLTVMNFPDTRNQGNTLKSVTAWNDSNTLGTKFKNKITVLPQSSGSGGTMKLLNSSQAAIPSTTATTSYRLVHTDGTMVMNVAQPQTMKKVISIANSNLMQQTNPKLTLNQNARVLHIQPQNFPSTSGTVMKTVTIAKNAIAMKAIPAGAIKTIPQTAAGTSSGLQKTIVHVAKTGQGVALASPRIINSSSSIGSNTETKLIIKPGNTMSAKKLVTSSNIQQRCVPGIKGVQYVRVLNQQAATGSSATPKMIFQTVNKVPATNTPVATVGSDNGPAGTSKLVLQTNRTYVVRNGIGKFATSASSVPGKPASLPTTRKILIGGKNVQSLDQYKSAASRITLKKEDIDSNALPMTIAKQPQSANSRTSVVKEGNIKLEDAKQQQQPVKAEGKFTEREVEFDGKFLEIETDVLRKNTAYGFPEEAYKKRPCNCTKSQCLKLYCDCFANGEFCYNCNCKDCYNTFEHEPERQKAIRCTLERNPNAFKPKIGSIGSTDDGTRLHTKGCNCKRSGCLKNYCECYEAKIPCSSNCKCIGCRNTDQFAQEFHYYGSSEASIKMTDDNTMLRVSGKNNIIYSKVDDSVASEQLASSSGTSGLKRSASFIDADISELPVAKQPHNFMTLDVIEATVQCMVAQADECLKRGCSIRTSERMILEEYGRCLLEIKEFAFKTEN
uniref:CRC domain-containing protein n=1 Tax=Anopheles atroparvus TaxID=41427 RepID=A0A182JAP7_ANOAO